MYTTYMRTTKGDNIVRSLVLRRREQQQDAYASLSPSLSLSLSMPPAALCLHKTDAPLREVISKLSILAEEGMTPPF